MTTFLCRRGSADAQAVASSLASLLQKSKRKGRSRSNSGSESPVLQLEGES